MSLESNGSGRGRTAVDSESNGGVGADADDDDGAAVRVRVWSRRRFDPDDFDPGRDKFKDVIVLPGHVVDDLLPDDAATGYVRASAPDSSLSVTLYALRFSDAYEPDVDADPAVPDAYLRRNVRERIERLPDADGSTLELEPVDRRDSGPLTVVRFSTRTESTRDDECRVHPTVLERVGVADGDAVELYNPETGGRLRSRVRAEPDIGKTELSLSTRSRKLLRAEIESRATDAVSRTLHLRRPVATGPEPDGVDGGVPTGFRAGVGRLTDRMFDAAVGYHEIRLRVMLGLNADEGRATARVNRETMRVLGIDDGDRIDLVADGETRSVRCYEITPDSHLIETDEDLDPEDVQERVILLPATEREATGVLCDDVVRVRRNTKHVAIRSIVPSMFGFLGVFVGGLQAINLAVSPAWYRPSIAIVALAALASVWIVLWPERQRCR